MSSRRDAQACPFFVDAVLNESNKLGAHLITSLYAFNVYNEDYTARLCSPDARDRVFFVQYLLGPCLKWVSLALLAHLPFLPCGSP